jgi:hypothetical protein
MAKVHILMDDYIPFPVLISSFCEFFNMDSEYRHKNTKTQRYEVILIFLRPLCLCI